MNSDVPGMNHVTEHLQLPILKKGFKVQLNFEKGTEDSECIFHDSFRGKS
jgi:hypothetical protein